MNKCGRRRVSERNSRLLYVLLEIGPFILLIAEVAIIYAWWYEFSDGWPSLGNGCYEILAGSIAAFATVALILKAWSLESSSYICFATALVGFGLLLGSVTAGLMYLRADEAIYSRMSGQMRYHVASGLKESKLDEVQRIFRCCGLESYRDWVNAAGRQNKRNIGSRLPLSCYNWTSFLSSRKDMIPSTWNRGCRQAVVGVVKWKLGWLCIAATLLAILELAMASLIFYTTKYLFKLGNDCNSTNNDKFPHKRSNYVHSYAALYSSSPTVQQIIPKERKENPALIMNYSLGDSRVVDDRKESKTTMTSQRLLINEISSPNHMRNSSEIHKIDADEKTECDREVSNKLNNIKSTEENESKRAVSYFQKDDPLICTSRTLPEDKIPSPLIHSMEGNNEKSPDQIISPKDANHNDLKTLVTFKGDGNQEVSEKNQYSSIPIVDSVQHRDRKLSDSLSNRKVHYWFDDNCKAMRKIVSEPQFIENMPLYQQTRKIFRPLAKEYMKGRSYLTDSRIKRPLWLQEKTKMKEQSHYNADLLNNNEDLSTPSGIKRNELVKSNLSDATYPKENGVTMKKSQTPNPPLLVECNADDLARLLPSRSPKHSSSSLLKKDQPSRSSMWSQ